MFFSGDSETGSDIDQVKQTRGNPVMDEFDRIIKFNNGIPVQFPHTATHKKRRSDARCTHSNARCPKQTRCRIDPTQNMKFHKNTPSRTHHCHHSRPQVTRRDFVHKIVSSEITESTCTRVQTKTKSRVSKRTSSTNLSSFLHAQTQI